jgi:hypothetical protein
LLSPSKCTKYTKTFFLIHKNPNNIRIAFFNKKYQLMIFRQEISQWRLEGTKAGERYFRQWKNGVVQQGNTLIQV